MAKSDYKIKGGKSKIIINPDKEKLKEAVMRAREKAREAILKNKYDDTSMKADMKTRYGSEKGEQIYYATIRKQAMSKKDKMEEFAGNYEGPLYAPHPDLVEGKKKGLWDNIHAKRKRGEKPAKPGDKDYPKTLEVEATYPSDFKKGSGVAVKKKGRPNAQGPESGKKEINERGDFWHPDPDKDRKLGGPGANQRAREDRAAASKPAKSDPKKLRSGESYYQYAMRMKKTKKEGYAPGDVEEKLGAVKAIPKSEQDAARARILAKAKAKREARLKKESTQVPSFGEFIAEGKGSPEALASLEKVKARQKVLDAHEKKTGKKLDISKTPEHKAHKKNFPGAKRTGKKVKGQKETPHETHNRRVNRNVSRIVKKGYTSKEKKEVESMKKHASRYD